MIAALLQQSYIEDSGAGTLIFAKEATPRRVVLRNHYAVVLRRPSLGFNAGCFVMGEEECQAPDWIICRPRSPKTSRFSESQCHTLHPESKALKRSPFRSVSKQMAGIMS